MRKSHALSCCAGLALLFLGAAPPSVEAHVLQYLAIDTRLAAHGAKIEFTMALGQTIDMPRASAEELRQSVETYLREHFQIKNKGVACPIAVTSVNPALTPMSSLLQGVFACRETVASVNDLSIRTDAYAEDVVNFDHYMIATIAGEQWEIRFTSDKQRYPDQTSAKYLGSTASFFDVAAKFAWMGMLHIFTGYDHILFLFSIVLLSRRTRRIIGLVTAFTVAHSITLILASFHIVEISPRIVEPAIALTIAYMAARNIMELRRQVALHHAGERWAATFAFGLVHGLGFASALAETEIPKAFFVPALLTFNVGIEAGQLCILAAVLPLLFLSDRLPYRRAALASVSGAILGLALLWFGARVFLGEDCSTLMPFGFLQILCI